MGCYHKFDELFEPTPPKSHAQSSTSTSSIDQHGSKPQELTST